MSKYRLGDYGTIMKGDEDLCQYDEPYEMISELNKLERQLAEAGELLDEILDAGYFESSVGLSYIRRFEQLKEKGDE